MRRRDALKALGALVPLPFYLKHRRALALRPLLEVQQSSGEAEVWSLVAGRGALGASASLDGWERLWQESLSRWT